MLNFVDNWGFLYFGDESKATQFVGSINSYWGAYSLNLDDYIYVVAYSDWIAFQGFLSEIHQQYRNQTTIFYGQSTSWKVSATGRFGMAPTSATAQSFNELNTQIQKSNSGQTPSGGWLAPRAGPYFQGQQLGGQMSELSRSVRWIWHSSTGESDPTSGGYNHQEYLIFRFRVGTGYPQNCLVCPQGFFCPQNFSAPQRCPLYQTSNTGATSAINCSKFPDRKYQNLNFFNLRENITGQYYTATNPSLEVSSLYFKVACDLTFQSRMKNKVCETQSSHLVSVELFGCPDQQTSTQSLEIKSEQLGSYIRYDITQMFCSSFVFISALKIQGLYTQKDIITWVNLGYVQATKAKENHYRFLLNDDYNIAPDYLVFHSEVSSEGVLINYSPGIESRYGTAEGDTFEFDTKQKFNKIFLTARDDTLIVNDTTWKNIDYIEPMFNLSFGNDSVECYTPCTIFGNPGSNIYQVKGTRMTIKDFSSLDTIDLRKTHSHLKHQSHLTASKLNSTLLEIVLSENESIILSPFQGSLSLVNFLFDAPSCYLVCNNCTTESQCNQCVDCTTCNTTHCVACNSTSYLKEGRCVPECGEKYLPNPEKLRECVYCNLDNCNGCPIANKCTVCEDNYVPDSNDQCQKCNLTFFSTQGDQKCSKCGKGCDICNKTECFECSPGFLYVPRLSKQFCYQNLASGFTEDQVQSVQTTILQGSLIDGGITLSSDGSLIDIDASKMVPANQKMLDSMQAAKYLNDDHSKLFYSLSENSMSSSGRLLSASNIKQGIIYDIPLIKQNDKRWGKKGFGPKKTLTIAAVGCLVTCHSMILNACGQMINSKIPNPDILNDWLVSNQGFDSSNNLKYTALDKFSLKFVSAKISDINKILDYFRRGFIVFLNVKRTYRNGRESRQHWVVMVGENGQNVLVKDPYWDITQDSFEQIRWANIYQLQGQCSLIKEKINLKAYTNSFAKSSLSYQSCYGYSKLAQKSQHYQDALKLMESVGSQIDLKTFKKIGSFTHLVKQQFPKSPSQTTICDQKDSTWKTLQDFFGIKFDQLSRYTLYDILSFEEGGSQLCSMAMLLQSMGIKDKEGKFYVPNTIDEELIRQDAYTERQVQIKIAGITKSLTTKNHIDFAKVASKKLFGLSKDIEILRNQDMNSMTGGQIETLKKDIRSGKNAYIFEIVSSDGIGTYFVYSLNQVSADGVQALDPVTSAKKLVQFSTIIGYTKFPRQKTFSAPDLGSAKTFLSGESHYHAILTYQPSTQTSQKLQTKKFYLTKWQRDEDTTLNTESFTVIDINTGRFSQEYQLSPIATFNQVVYILYSIEVYQHKDFLLDTTSLISNQKCTNQELMAFVRMHQGQYQTSQEESQICFDAQSSSLLLSSQCSQGICSPEICRSTFMNRVNSLKSKYQTLLSNLPADSRSCAFLKHAYYQDRIDEQQLIKLVQDQAFPQLAYSLMYSEAVCTRMRPRQVSEVFYGMYFEKSPAIPQTVSLVNKEKVKAKLIEIIGSESKSTGKSQEMIGRAICEVAGESCSEKLSKKMTTQEFGLWIEEKGYLRSDLKLEEAIAGDIVVFSGNKDYPFGHVAVRGDSVKIWYSDHTQNEGANLYESSSFIIYN